MSLTRGYVSPETMVRDQSSIYGVHGQIDLMLGENGILSVTTYDEPCDYQSATINYTRLVELIEALESFRAPMKAAYDEELARYEAQRQKEREEVERREKAELARLQAKYSQARV